MSVYCLPHHKIHSHSLISLSLSSMSFLNMFPCIPQGSPPPLYQYPPPYEDISGLDSLSSPLLLETAIDASGELWIGVVCNILTPGSFRRQYRTSCMEITQLITLIHTVAHSQIWLNVAKHPVSVVPNRITATFKQKVKTAPRQGFLKLL